MFRVAACFDTLVADHGTATCDAHEGLITATTTSRQGTRRVEGTIAAAAIIHGEIGVLLISLLLATVVKL